MPNTVNKLAAALIIALTAVSIYGCSASGTSNEMDNASDNAGTASEPAVDFKNVQDNAASNTSAPSSKGTSKTADSVVPNKSDDVYDMKEMPAEVIGEAGTGQVSVPSYWEDLSGEGGGVMSDSTSVTYVADPNSRYESEDGESFKRYIKLESSPCSFMYAASALSAQYQEDPRYEDVTSEVSAFYSHSSAEVTAYMPAEGVYIHHVIVDAADDRQSCVIATTSSTLADDTWIDEYLYNWLL